MRRYLAAALTAACVSALPENASGQSRAFDAQIFKPAIGEGAFLSIDGATVSKHLGFSVGGLIGYQHDPIVIRACAEVDAGTCADTRGALGSPLEHHVSAEVWATLSIFKILEIGLAIPAVLYQGGKPVRDSTGAVVIAPVRGHAGLGDPRLALKLDLWHGVFRQKSERIGLALVPVLSFPIGNLVAGGSFMGDSTVTVHPRLVFEARWKRVRLGIEIGYLWREHKEFWLADLGHRITFGAAVEVRIWRALLAILEATGQSGFTPEISSTPLEIDGALRYGFGNGLVLTVGAGGGILAAVATPAFRVFTSLAWSPPEKTPAPPTDMDGDGFTDEVDECPLQAEDKDGFEDTNGCPDRDNDGDGVKDGDDGCPLVAEDDDGFEDKDGCPDPGNDGDGLKDAKDGCPDQAEDEDGNDDADGCPDLDDDGDGVNDADDSCPAKPEDEDGFEDEDGCPDPDNDVDGVPDPKDECPDEKEIMNGFEDADGCPDKGKALLEVVKGELKLLENILFAKDSAKIVGKKSFKILDTVIEILKSNPDMKVRIEGHTDDTGTREHNLELSQKRADSVMEYLLDEGIPEGNLTAVGYGPDKPIADNATKEGKSKNRRVVFVIVE